MIIVNIFKLFSKIIYRIHFPKFIIIKTNDCYHKLVFVFLKKYFNRAYKILQMNNTENCVNNSGIIWIFWWQGYKYMPSIVKRCFHSINEYSNGHRVILITKNNIKKYTNIPNYIYLKVKNKEITLTHLSDILRFNLLSRYGGLWIDSTVYCTSKLSNKYFQYLYTSSAHNSNKFHIFVSDKWTGFLIGGSKHNPVFDFINIFLQIYWKNNYCMIDYFLIDYALYYIYKYNIGNFKNYVDKVASDNNPNLYELVNNLNCTFSLRKYKSIIKDTNLFKLTYKKKFIDNGYTFYSKLLNNDL